MNCETAKTIKLSAILDQIGACKIRTSNHEIWYLSPFRKEQTASFKIDTRKNVFYDFGEGFGGNVLDFIMRYYRCDLPNALKILSQNFHSFSFQQPPISVIKEEVNSKKNYEITYVLTLSNPVLMDYLKSRKLNLELCRNYLYEVHYQLNGKTYFGIGFKNDENGFEIRNKYVKLCLGKKWFTHIKNDSKSAVILESWSDFIALLTLHPEMEKAHGFVILNSLVLSSKIDAIMQNYERIFLTLDSDEAGSKVTQILLEKGNEKCVDSRSFFSNSKDLNDFLIEKTPVKNNRRL